MTPAGRASPSPERGVFATRAYGPGEVIAADPVIELSPGDADVIRTTRLRSYYFYWHSRDDAAIVFGIASLLNHSYTPNARFDPDRPGRRMLVTAIAPIGRGEEITINYGGEPGSCEPVSFPLSGADMQNYSFGTGSDTTRKGGATQPRPEGSDSKKGGDTGSIPAVVGKSTPVVARGGAVNNGTMTEG